VTSNRLAVAQTNLESTGKKYEEVLDDKKSGNNNGPEPRTFLTLKVEVTWREIDRK